MRQCRIRNFWRRLRVNAVFFPQFLKMVGFRNCSLRVNWTLVSDVSWCRAVNQVLSLIHCIWPWANITKCLVSSFLLLFSPVSPSMDRAARDWRRGEMFHQKQLNCRQLRHSVDNKLLRRSFCLQVCAVIKTEPRCFRPLFSRPSILCLSHACSLHNLLVPICLICCSIPNECICALKSFAIAVFSLSFFLLHSRYLACWTRHQYCYYHTGRKHVFSFRFPLEYKEILHFLLFRLYKKETTNNL